MTKAETIPTTRPRPEPDPQPVIDRLRLIAAEAGDRLLLADGPPHPDHALLGLCGEALHCLRRHAALERENFGTAGVEWVPGGCVPTPWAAESRELDLRAHRLMHKIRKLRATTPAGIYAKALLVRASASGAKALAKSLAEELVACAALRESLWPAGGGELV